MLFQFVVFKRPDLFEFFGQIALSDAREKKAKIREIGSIKVSSKSTINKL